MATEAAGQGKGWKIPFFAVWVGQAFSLVGSALVQFALIWWLTELTGSAVVLATASIVGMVPTIALGPVAGPLIDRWSRRWILVVSDAAIALFTLVLAILFWFELVQVWHVYVILFLRSLGDAFQLPTMRATTSLMVPNEQLTRVAGMNSTLAGIVRIVAPALGALMLSILSTQAVLAVDMVTALLAILPLLLIAVPQPKASSGAATPRRSIKGDLVEGFRYFWGHRGLRLMVFTTALWRLGNGPATRFMPLLVSDHFGAGATELGWMQSALGIGIVAGGFILSLWGGFRRRMLNNVVAVATVGLAFLVVALVPSHLIVLAVLAMALIGLAVPMVTGPVRATYQTVVPPEMQGRFFTVMGAVAQAAVPLGLALGELWQSCSACAFCGSSPG